MRFTASIVLFLLGLTLAGCVLNAEAPATLAQAPRLEPDLAIQPIIETRASISQSRLSASLGPGPLPESLPESNMAPKPRVRASAETQKLLGFQAKLNAKFNALRRPPNMPSDHEKRPWTHSLPLLAVSQDASFSSDFGWRSLWGRKDFHGGIDLMAKPGTAIRAILPGRIVYLERAGRYGGLVLEGMGEHAGHHFTYWHINPTDALYEGAFVDAGSNLGQMAPWGANTHLHYAVHRTDGLGYKARKDANALHPVLYHKATKTADVN